MFRHVAEITDLVVVIVWVVLRVVLESVTELREEMSSWLKENEYQRSCS